MKQSEISKIVTELFEFVENMDLTLDEMITVIGRAYGNLVAQKMIEDNLDKSKKNKVDAIFESFGSKN